MKEKEKLQTAGTTPQIVYPHDHHNTGGTPAVIIMSQSKQLLDEKIKNNTILPFTEVAWKKKKANGVQH